MQQTLEDCEQVQVGWQEPTQCEHKSLIPSNFGFRAQDARHCSLFHPEIGEFSDLTGFQTFGHIESKNQDIWVELICLLLNKGSSLEAL